MNTLYSKFEKIVNNKLLPIATKMGNNNAIQAVSTGLMYALPLTLTASFFSLLVNFPVKSVALWFEGVGLKPHFEALMGGTLDMIALFMIISIPYAYIKIKGKANTNPIMGAFLALAAFVILMPQHVGEGESIFKALSYDFIGSSGMFAAILVGLSIAQLYILLAQNRKLIFKMPEGVPPMVTQSFEPLFVSLIILVGVVLLRFAVALTPVGNIFNLVNIVIAQPLMKLGGSPFALIAIAVVANSLFFFGIHPNVINTAITPLLFTMVFASIEAFQTGAEMQYKVALITNAFTNNDAVGSTLSLLIAILIFGKSKRYRSLAKMTIVPNIFNINEPVIFGFPIMLNPILLLPFALSTVITGFIGYFGAVTNFISYYNPMMSIGLPWTVPRVITSYFAMGWEGLVLRLLCMIVMVFVYLPFLKILDRQEMKNEQELVADFTPTDL